MRYSVVVIPGEDHGYYVTVPLLPGCFSQGESVDEALAHVREAITGHIATLADLGEEIPQERGSPQLFTLDLTSDVTGDHEVQRNARRKR